MYWLITEPARGLSFRVPVERDDRAYPEAALQADERLCGEFASYGQAVESGDINENECSFLDWLQGDYTVTLVSEG